MKKIDPAVDDRKVVVGLVLPSVKHKYRENLSSPDLYISAAYASKTQ
jgi:hypothetical protein